MPSFFRRSLSKVVAKLRSLKRVSENSVMEQTSNDRAEREDQSTANGEASLEDDGTHGWESHCTRLPELEDYLNASDTGDSGYGSQHDVQSPAEVKYLALPFKTRHYFLTYVQRILEATCFRYARDHLRSYLEDPKWKQSNLRFWMPEYKCDDLLVGRDWLAEDEIELLYMVQCIAKFHKVTQADAWMLESVIELRNKVVHRADQGIMSFFKVEEVRQLPRYLGDDVKEKEMEDLFEFVLGDDTLDEHAKAAVEQKMLTPQPCTSKYQVLGRIQTLLEESCFEYAERTIPDHLRRQGWGCAEQVELPRWGDIFWYQGAPPHNVEKDQRSAHRDFPDMNSQDFGRYMRDARVDLRNVAAHRLLLSDEKMMQQVHMAICIALFFDDWTRAIEIEIVAEMWFTKTSRKEVLDRLQRVFRDGKIEGLYEWRRRIELGAFLVEEQGKLAGVLEEEELVISDTWHVGMERKAGLYWSPSMHECLS